MKSGLSRRNFFRAGVLGAAGAFGLSKAKACMECLTDKLDGKFPIGKTNIVGSQVIPVAYQTTRCCALSRCATAGRNGPDEVSDRIRLRHGDARWPTAGPSANTTSGPRTRN